jgi:anti-anti-sigma factor
MSLQIQKSDHNGIKVLQLVGRLDTDTSPNFELDTYDLLQAGGRQFLVDMSQVTYVSSAGLRVLLALAKKVEGQGSMALSGLKGVVREVFDKSGFARMFTIYPDISAALGGASVASTPAPRAADASSDAMRILGVAPQSRPAAASQAPQGFFAKLLAMLGIGKK